MCDPVTVISAAASIGGALLQQSAANKAQKAQSNVLANERRRQQRLQEAQNLIFEDSKGKSGKDATEADMAEAEAERSALYEALLADDKTTDSMGQQFENVTSNQVVQDEIDRRRGVTRDNSVTSARLRAALDSFGDASFGQAIERGRNTQDIGVLGNFGRGYASLVPLEMEAAAQKGAGRAALGSILGTAGQIGMFAGGAGMDNLRNIFGSSGNVSPGINLRNVFSSGVRGAPAGAGVQFGAGGPGVRLVGF